jgi:hypothetical protein
MTCFGGIAGGDIMNHLNKALGLALMFTTAVVACAAPEIPSTQTEPEVVDQRTPKAAAAPATGDADAATDGGAAPPEVATNEGGAAPGTTPAPSSCAASADYDSCFTCCDAPSGGALAAADQAFEACSCGGGACSAVCAATFCNGQKGSAECNTCLTNTCDTAPATACTTPACQAAQQCVKNDCAGKQ